MSAAAVDNGADDHERLLRGEDFADMTPRLDVAATIKGILGQQSLAAIIGPSGCGKTFFAKDMGAHVAAGMQYRGRAVQSGLVVYGALEGAPSARNRFYAWRTAKLRDRSAAIPLRSMIDPINLRDPLDCLRMVEFIKRAESDFEAEPRLCFIDTLSRAMAGGNENAPDDMGALIRGADSIRVATGATVVLVHHLGKDENRGARGHNSFFAALDTEITIRVAGDQRIAAITKQRDWASGDELAFRLDVVEIGRDSEGTTVTSCVAVPADMPAEKRKQPSGKNQVSVLAALHEWKRANPTKDYITSLELRQIAESQGIRRNRLQEVTQGLETFSWLQPAVGGFRFFPEVT